MAKMMTPQEMFEAWQKMFNPANYTPGATSMQMFPDLKEVEKKLSELHAVEGWLNANLGMLQMSIKTLEYQRAMLRGGEKAREVMKESRKPTSRKG